MGHPDVIILLFFRCHSNPGGARTDSIHLHRLRREFNSPWFYRHQRPRAPPTHQTTHWKWGPSSYALQRVGICKVAATLSLLHANSLNLPDSQPVLPLHCVHGSTVLRTIKYPRIQGSRVLVQLSWPKSVGHLTHVSYHTLKAFVRWHLRPQVKYKSQIGISTWSHSTSWNGGIALL